MKWCEQLLRIYHGVRNGIHRARIRLLQKNSFCGEGQRLGLTLLQECDLPMQRGKPLVSVIVPNYNHAPYLRKRLDSIYGQTYENYEVILLDDCSQDGSRAILEEYGEKYSGKTRCCFNEENVGRANLQWNRGMELAGGEYIWIAESDDWCEPDFLEKLVPYLSCQSVMIAFARSVFMKEGRQTWSTEEYLHDCDFDWKHPFAATGYEALCRGFGVKNIIPNVSSALFRNVGSIPGEVLNLWENMRLCGDWIFYLYLVKGGALVYTNETTNYYRVHEGSTSLKVQKSEDYYREREEVSKYIARNFKVPFEVFEENLRLLKEHYAATQKAGEGDCRQVEQWYRLEEIKRECDKRPPNVLLCGFSMKMGGGEIFPIHLSNALRRAGVPVTFVDCRMEEYDEKVRRMLHPSVPLVELKNPLALIRTAERFGCEVVHSHHGSVDKLVSELLGEGDYCQVITLHGMYEAIKEHFLVDLLEHVTRTCKIFAYIADKNLQPFKEHHYFESCTFVKIGNGLERGSWEPVEREELGIPKEAFVLCLVSRARMDKGWLEAAEAVIGANEVSSREIHLILVGEGEAYDAIRERVHSRYIHAVGAKPNPRAYFAAADMGLLPSRFAGESFPLSVIESLMCGKPVLATDVGEISEQISLKTGERAGILVQLQEGQIPVEHLRKIILRLARNKEEYEYLQKNTARAALRFDIEKVARQYLELYKWALRKK